MILDEVKEHRDIQNRLWGEQNHVPHEWLAILVEEIGEVAKAIVEGTDNYRTELLQVAAVAVAAIESWDRQ